MDYYSALPDLIESMAKHIPNSERAMFARKANECLNESLDLSAWFNQLATGYDRDLGDIDLLTTSLNYVNLTLTELSHATNSLKADSESKAKFANRANITTTSKDQGGAE
jgi:hypothetical protein